MTRGAIAIVGIGCRFPGARGPEGFWRLLRDRRDAISEVPPDRFDLKSVYDARPGIPGKIYSRWGGFLDHVDQFDPYFFGISPREAASMDPQHRLLLEVAWEGLEDAGLVPERLVGHRVGVFVGLCTNDYGNLVTDPADIDIYFAAGNARSVLSGRLSYALGLEGPSIVVDTACSTSLVAVHLACQSLHSGESVLAIAGGVNLVLLAEPSIGFCQAQMLASDGHCKAFDARANGFVRSDGVGIVVLKKLSQALVDNDPIYAVIRGSAVNNDGRSGGLLMTPSRPGQEAVLRDAYRDGEVSPGEIQYVEAHGTGTSVGDPVEALALGSVLGMNRPPERPCRIGSVKTNIGHTEGASGVAGLIKVALAMKHGEIPASLLCDEPNPEIPWKDLPLVVQREASPWPETARPALAGVSSFGISGTNAHVVVEQAPPTVVAQQPVPDAADRSYLLPISAHSQEALRAMAEAYRSFMSARNGGDNTSAFADICYTASVRRTHHDFRLAVAGRSPDHVVEQLDAFLAGENHRGMVSGQRIPDAERKLVFVFPGQGSQWLGMARQLLAQEPIFRDALERCAEAIRVYAEWSLLDEIQADDSTSRLDELDVVQPLLFAVQVALATLWRSWGIQPDAVVGHSMGEVAAAHIAGILSLDQAARIICRRSQVVKGRASGKGGMAVLELSRAAAESFLIPYADRLAIAACNGPTTTVISGHTATLAEVGAVAQRQEIFFQLVKVDYASHSPHMDDLRDELLDTLGEIRPQRAQVTMLSTVGTPLSLDGAECGAAYWVRNLREPVMFADAVRELAQTGSDIFLEISAHPMLGMSIAHTLRDAGRHGTILPSMRRGEGDRDVMLESLGALYAAGYPVDWRRQHPSGGRVVALPSYAWQRERFWLEAATNGNRPASSRHHRTHADAHPLLGRCFKSAAHPGTLLWEAEVGTRLLPYLSDHAVGGAVVFPAAAYAEMALSAAVQAFGPGPHTVRNLSFKKALFFSDDQPRTIQLALSPATPGEVTIQFFSTSGKADDSWTLHATGSIRLAKAGVPTPEPEHPAAIRERCSDTLAAADFYKATAERGLVYGPSFQGLEELWRRDGEAIGRLRRTKTVQTEEAAYKIHPALLDACFQALAAALPAKDATTSEGATFLPVALDTLRLYDRPDGTLWSWARLALGAEANAATIGGDVLLLADDGRVVAEALGFSVQRLETRTSRTRDQNLDDWFYEIQWQPKPRPDADQQPSRAVETPGTWLILADSGGVGDSLRSHLEAEGSNCVIVRPGEQYQQWGPDSYEVHAATAEHFHQLLREVSAVDRPLRGVIHLWSLGDNTPPEEHTLETIRAAQELCCISALQLVQALASIDSDGSTRLWLITRGAQPVGDTIAPLSMNGSSLAGLARVIAVEHPELRCTTIDLGAETTEREIMSLIEELHASDGENQIALRADSRYVSRLVRWSPETRIKKYLVAPDEQAFRLELPTLGILDNFVLREATRRDPGPSEAEIRVRAVGLNFRDVLIAMGLVPPIFEGLLEFGFECAGTVTRVGDGVEGLAPGDDVLAGAPACFGSFVTTSESMVVPKPPHLSFEEAATIPIAFLTAHYALNHLGRMRAGERVLIHAAAGGVGQAAVQLAQRAGAEIFATAGTPEKREFLRSQGVKHVMDSRSLDFAEEVMRLTDGKGVDLVLNSLAGDFIPKSLLTLAPGGRFLEIGKVDILQNRPLGLGFFERNISFFAIDLAQLLLKQPAFCRSLLREAMDCFGESTFKPLPHHVFPISRVEEAFRYLAQARHIGKVVVSLQQEDRVLVVPPKGAATRFRSDATYLITGGLGGVGLVLSQWMVERGARHLLLIGRSGVSSPAASEAVDVMTRAGANVKVAAIDIGSAEQLANVLKEAGDSMPPLRGVVHAAAVLDDGILLQQNRERFNVVMRPKIDGAWNLHQLTANCDVDFFVLFSSGASVLGSPGQANYVAANAFVDGLAYYRRALGRPALSINWGAWAQVGQAARPDRVQHLTSQGILPFAPEQGMQLLDRLLQCDAPQVVAMSMNWERLLATYSPPLLSELAAEVAQSVGSVKPQRSKDALTRDKLLAVEEKERQPMVEAFLTQQIAKVLRCSPSKIDVHQPLTRLGLDSLMAVELKNRIEMDLEMTLPVTALLQGPSLAQLSARLVSQLDPPAEAPAAAPAADTALDSARTDSAQTDQETAEQLLAKVNELPDETVDSLLRQMVVEVDGPREKPQEMGI
jgi:acyl transferase domain-containing protein/NADPH:quinone reductase-like Zn-dependent oxidoreductase/acyl carrier protein